VVVCGKVPFGMNFLQPLMIWSFAGAGGARSSFILWQRRKVIQVRFSTLRFLKVVAAKTSRSAKIENLLLLLLRCLIVALVAWAAMRPVLTVGGGTKLIGGKRGRAAWVLIVDNSMSMELPPPAEETRLEKGQRRAGRWPLLADLKGRRRLLAGGLAVQRFFSRRNCSFPEAVRGSHQGRRAGEHHSANRLPHGPGPPACARRGRPSPRTHAGAGPADLSVHRQPGGRLGSSTRAANL